MVSEQFTDQPFHIALAHLMALRGLSFRQLEYKTGLSASYLSYLKNRPELNRPTRENIEKIAPALGVSPSYFKEYRDYIAKEKVETQPGVTQMVLTSKPIPLLGYASATGFKEAIELAEEYIPSTIDADFAVKAAGDCLIDAGISDGDIIFVRRQPDAKAGDLALVRYNGEVTLKFYHPKNTHAELRPANKKYKPIEVTDFQVLGIVVSALKKSIKEPY